MKKKIIISLILAMCCIVASIPASAVTDDVVCIEHGPWLELCGGFYKERTVAHNFEVEGYAKKCYYTEVRYYTRRYCEICAYEDETLHSHIHGYYGHEYPELCGGETWNYCTIFNID